MAAAGCRHKNPDAPALQDPPDYVGTVAFSAGIVFDEERRRHLLSVSDGDAVSRFVVDLHVARAVGGAPAKGVVPAVEAAVVGAGVDRDGGVRRAGAGDL